MKQTLSSSLVEKYHHDGYCFPLQAMSVEEISGYRKKLEAYEAEKGEPLSGIYQKKTHLLFTWANQLIRHPVILDAVESIIGPNILCWGSDLFIKEAQTPNFISWHQDSTYWGLGSHSIVTAWVALSESSIENGCMRVIPETHREQIRHEDTFEKNNLLSRGQEVAVNVDEKQAVDLILKPGEFSLHHVLIFHGSRPNSSNNRRIGFAVRYISPQIKQMTGKKDFATLVRGKDQYHHFELEPSPTYDLAPEMVEYHKQVYKIASPSNG